jgi:ATP-dependent RNA helicase DeaD
MAALCTLLQSAEGESSLIFGRTKYGVEKLGKQLSKLGFTVGTLHGNKSQRAREEVLTAFRRGRVQTLLATNVAARGLDIHGIYQVINYELPESSDLFTHRIGRTGRMGRQGKAITLLVPADMPKWRIMARNLGQKVALQRLTIDEETRNTISIAHSETPMTQLHEKNDEKQPKREHKQGTSDQKPAREALPKQDSRIASDANRRQKKSTSSRVAPQNPSWQPERSFSSKERYGRRGAGRQSSFARNKDERKVHTFETFEPQYRTTRRKPRAAVARRIRYEGASNRSASR